VQASILKAEVITAKSKNLPVKRKRKEGRLMLSPTARVGKKKYSDAALIRQTRFEKNKVIEESIAGWISYGTFPLVSTICV
jgi:hypothetical protein